MISFSEETRFKYCVLAKDALKAALVSANRGAIECSSKWKSDMEFARAERVVFVHPGEEEEGGEQRAAEMRQEFSSSFTTTHSFAAVVVVVVVLGVCVLRGEAFRDAFRARGGAMKMRKCIAVSPLRLHHIARWISPRETPTTSSSQSLFEEKDKKEGK